MTMTAPPQASVPGPPAARGAPKGKEKKGKGKLLGVVGAVVVLAVAGGGYMVMQRAGVHRGPVAPQPGPMRSLPTTTLNLQDGHLLQIGLDYQLTAAADTKAAGAEQPALVNLEIVDLSKLTYAELLTPAGKEAAQAQLAAGFRSVLDKKGMAEQLYAIYYTTFVMQ